MSKRSEYGHVVCGAETASGGECMLRLYRGEERCFHHTGWRAEQRAAKAARKPRAREASGEVKLVLWASPQVAGYLDRLVAVGLHGSDRSEAALRLVEQGLGRLMPPPIVIPYTQRKKRRKR